MDSRTKDELLAFFSSTVDQVGDLASWIGNPQRKFHRHELFGLDVAAIEIASGAHFRLRDLGYGGCGVAGFDDQTLSQLGKQTQFPATLRFLDCREPFQLVLRHVQKLLVGCEFVDISESQRQFLRHFIQYMDASIQLRQAEPASVFPAYRDHDWLNLSGHRQAIRFSIRLGQRSDQPEASLVYTYESRHVYCTWRQGVVDAGLLNGTQAAPAERQEMLRQIVAILIGIRQGASLAGFEPIVMPVVKLLLPG